MAIGRHHDADRESRMSLARALLEEPRTSDRVLRASFWRAEMASDDPPRAAVIPLRRRPETDTRD